MHIRTCVCVCAYPRIAVFTIYSWGTHGRQRDDTHTQSKKSNVKMYVDTKSLVREDVWGRRKCVVDLRRSMYPWLNEDALPTLHMHMSSVSLFRAIRLFTSRTYTCIYTIVMIVYDTVACTTHICKSLCTWMEERTYFLRSMNVPMHTNVPYLVTSSFLVSRTHSWLLISLLTTDKRHRELFLLFQARSCAFTIFIFIYFFFFLLFSLLFVFVHLPLVTRRPQGYIYPGSCGSW